MIDWYGYEAPNPCIWAIGDSHTQYMEPLIRRHPECGYNRDSPPTAWMLAEENSTSLGREHLFRAVRRIGKDDKLVLVYGEVDARLQIPLRCATEKIPFKKCVDDTVRRYGSVLKEVFNVRGDDIIVHGIIPMGREVFLRRVEFPKKLESEDDFPEDFLKEIEIGRKNKNLKIFPDMTTGILYATLENDLDVDAYIEELTGMYCYFNEELGNFCFDEDFPYFDIMSMIAPSGRAKTEWLSDNHHLKGSATTLFEYWLRECYS